MTRQLVAKNGGSLDATHLSTGPYYFPDLADADADAEQAAIDAGQIKAGCLRYAGRVRAAPDRSAARLDVIAER